MKISNVRIYDIEESIIESGLPKSSTPEYSLSRARKLGKAKIGSGHDCYLKGILVRFRLQADHAFWIQFMRYHFADIVSSESKMHCITDMELKYHPLVNNTQKVLLETMINYYNRGDCEEWYRVNYGGELSKPLESKAEFFEMIVMNAPIGLEISAGITTNLLQLKNIRSQRRGHKMSSWKEFCDWVESIDVHGLIINKNE